MTVELLQTLSLVAYIVAGLFLLVSTALFFLLDVPKLYGDISGRTAKKAIDSIRKQNESSGTKAYKPSKVNSERGKITDKITSSGRLEQHPNEMAISVGTEEISKAVDFIGSNETTVLTGTLPQSGETTVLVQEEQTPSCENDKDFHIDVEMSFTETTEIIE